MKIGIVGSGIVGQTVGRKLVELGHNVVLGTRDPSRLDEKKGWAGSLSEWLTSVNHKARVGTFAEAAAHGEVVVNATSGLVSLEALRMAGAANLNGKVLIDIANELDFSQGMPPRSLANDELGLAEKIQNAFPGARVVKTLNTVNAYVMVDPKSLAGGDHTVFISGNDAAAKAQVADILRSLGWTDILDLGDITSARGPEMYMPLWLRAWGRLGNAPFNVKIVR
jgi:hypothetical protein